MNHTPETRSSLIAAVQDPSDEIAWKQFAEIYRPVIVRVAEQKGMQPADADDLAQQVLVSVSRAISNFQPDKQRARFRTWLHRIIHNAVVNATTRNRAEAISGDPFSFEQVAGNEDPDSRLLRLEYRREVFRWAARQICHEFQTSTWDAFWRTAVNGLPADDVAAQLELSVGAVYAARSRVMRRLRQTVMRFADAS